MTLPNLMIIGVAKAGTTSFYRYLDSIGISFLGVTWDVYQELDLEMKRVNNEI